MVQVLDHYNSLLAELRAHRDWVDGVEKSLAFVRRTPLADDVGGLQRQVNSVQVFLTARFGFRLLTSLLTRFPFIPPR